MKLTTNETKRKQIIKKIIENIKNGTLQPGDRLATIRDMSAHFGVSFSVIQKALQELSSDGFVECLGASGYYIRKDLPTEKLSDTDSEKQQTAVQAPAEERIYLSATENIHKLCCKKAAYGGHTESCQAENDDKQCGGS